MSSAVERRSLPDVKSATQTIMAAIPTNDQRDDQAHATSDLVVLIGNLQSTRLRDGRRRLRASAIIIAWSKGSPIEPMSAYGPELRGRAASEDDAIAGAIAADMWIRGTQTVFVGQQDES
jgi:hypothetical protein